MASQSPGEEQEPRELFLEFRVSPRCVCAWLACCDTSPLLTGSLPSGAACAASHHSVLSSAGALGLNCSRAWSRREPERADDSEKSGFRCGNAGLGRGSTG